MSGPGAESAKYFWDAQPSWPEPVRPPSGAPNILVVVLDDVGYAQLGCYGSDIETPNIDRLAEQGLQYTNFHTTSLCSASRTSLLTGRNHHRNGMGRIIELATGFPGYNSIIPRENGFLSELLVDVGYATMAAGKWHLTPESECHAAAPRHSWPLGRGFERFYGFMSGENHQFAPMLYRDNHILPGRPPVTGDYHLTADLVAESSHFLCDLASLDPQRPFFLYFCPGACHSPHQPPASYLAAYRGRFDDGWDAWRKRTFARQQARGLFPAGTELSPRPSWVPAWDELSDGQRRLSARYMEAFAAYLTHTDHCVGDLLSLLERLGIAENTLTVLISDNGASSEGGPSGSLNDLALWNRMERDSFDEALERIDEIGGPYVHNNYPWGWTVAGNTPFRRWKREVHEGGVADPLILHWPARLRAPGLRRQYVHVVDLMPTVLAAAGPRAPTTLRGVEQSRLDGVDISATFDDPAAPDPRRLQYYEMFGCRALYRDGWKAVTYHELANSELDFRADAWELYHVATDPSECHDLAAQEPARLREMIEDWWIEAARNQVLPLDNRPFSAWTRERPSWLPPRDRYVYYPGNSPVPEVSAVNVKRRWHKVSAELEIPQQRLPEGTLISQGSALGGWALYLVGGALRFVHSLLGREETNVEAKLALEAGRHVVWMICEPDGESGRVRLGVDNDELASGVIPVLTPVRFSLTGAGLTCGYSGMLPVSRSIAGPFPLEAPLAHVSVEVAGPEYVDPAGEAWVALITQ